MNVVFRVDAAVHIGTGHVMRCMSIARALKLRGVVSTFIMRDHLGHLKSFVEGEGFEATLLPAPQDTPDTTGQCGHAAWLGVDWQTDAEQTMQACGSKKVDWLIVDHYGIDQSWEAALSAVANRILVIDDLADRGHLCDALLDQTYLRDEAAYASLVPRQCRLLVGSAFALLRPEFAALRQVSISRRQLPADSFKLLITLGGIDQYNVTTTTLQALQTASLPSNTELTVLMGTQAPWKADVQAFARSMKWPTHVIVGADNVGELMASSDLAIGAAGGTSWERCCLGLPTVMLVLAENQSEIAVKLRDALAVSLIPQLADLPSVLPNLIERLVTDRKLLGEMSDHAARIVDGRGIERVVNYLEQP